MPLAETLAILMVVAVCGFLFFGYPVALTLGGVSLAFAALGHITGAMSFSFIGALPQRVYGVMTNEVLLAIPLFIFMGVMLERSRIAEELLETMGRLFGSLRGGLGISVAIVGTLLAAAKGVVGATTVTMGLIVLPTMLRYGYDKRLAAGTVAANRDAGADFSPRDGSRPARRPALDRLSGRPAPAGQLCAVVGDRERSVRRSHRAGLRAGGNVHPLSDLHGRVFPKTSPAIPPEPGAPKGLALAGRLIAVMVAPLLLILAVLGSILGGIATPTKQLPSAPSARSCWRQSRGTLGAALAPVVQRTTQVTCMIFVILIGATMFSLVFRGLGGDDMVHRALGHLPGGAAGAILVVMLAMFLLGFVMDAFEIIFVVVPIVAVPLLALHKIDRSGSAS